MQGRPGCSSDGNRPLVGAVAFLASQLPRQTQRTFVRLQLGSPGFPRDRAWGKSYFLESAHLTSLYTWGHISDKWMVWC